MDQKLPSSAGASGKYEKTGLLTVRVFTAGGAIPLEGALVTIRGGDEDNSDFSADLISGQDGQTRTIGVPAPSSAMSREPGNIQPYAGYIIEVEKEGYYSFLSRGVPVFEKINSIQPVELVPITPYDSSENRPLLPSRKEITRPGM